MNENLDLTKILDGPISRTKESWDGVDAESYMQNLRDDSVDQEVASDIIDDRKTIEERAKYAGIVSQYKSDHRYDPKSVESGYMQGATEQKDIDVKKAKNAFDKSCGWLSTYAWYNAVVEEFIKNMEE